MFVRACAVAIAYDNKFSYSKKMREYFSQAELLSACQGALCSTELDVL
jgi:hypothetical protein